MTLGMLRPLLVVRYSETPASGRAARRGQPCPPRPGGAPNARRLVVQTDQVLVLGPEVVLGIARSARTGAPGPTVVGLEIDARDHRHWAVLFALAGLCDWAPSARRALSRLIECPASTLDVDLLTAEDLRAKLESEEGAL